MFVFCFMPVLLTFPSIWLFASPFFSLGLLQACVCPLRCELCLCVRDDDAELIFSCRMWRYPDRQLLKVTPVAARSPCLTVVLPPACCRGTRWGLYGPVIAASRHHSRSTGALYAPDVCGAAGEGWVHAHYCVGFCPFQFPLKDVHLLSWFLFI